MPNQHPIHNINISLDVTDCLLDECEEFINSKRLSSRISKIDELIHVLWIRNIFNTDKHLFSTIFKHLPISQQSIIRDYIVTLNPSEIVHNSGNIYG